MDKGCRGETEGQRIQVPTNPLRGYCADPDLKMVDGRWYMYCTQDGLPGWSSTVMSVYESTDLCTWQEHRILDLHDVPWWEGRQGAWAPCPPCHQGICSRSRIFLRVQWHRSLDS